MTEKRFTYNVNKNCIECDGIFVAYLDSVDGFRIANKLTVLAEENEQLKEHQRTLEAKIVRLKDRVKTFEKHYSLKDIERYKKMDNCNCITSKRLGE